MSQNETQPTDYPSSWGYQAAPPSPVELAVDSFVASLTDSELTALLTRTRGR